MFHQTPTLYVANVKHLIRPDTIGMDKIAQVMTTYLKEQSYGTNAQIQIS